MWLVSADQNSPYEVAMAKGEFKVLCRQELTQKQTALLAKRIKEDYRVHLIMDNLPVSSLAAAGVCTVTAARHQARAPRNLAAVPCAPAARCIRPVPRIAIRLATPLPRLPLLSPSAATCSLLNAGRYQDDPRDARRQDDRHV
jgi:hypothetical protein